MGYSDNPEMRLFEHNNSERTTFTSKYRPWLIKKHIALGKNRGFAMKIEKAIKKLKSRVILEKIIEDVNSVEEIAQLVRVPMYRD